jgi:hypothetical protein
LVEAGHLHMYPLCKNTNMPLPSPRAATPSPTTLPKPSVKHQSLKKLTKREVLERSHADLAAARCGEEEGRFDLARRLTEVELSKRYAFIELVVGSVHAHLMFFRNGNELLGRLEAPTNDALAIGEHLRGQEAAKKVGGRVEGGCALCRVVCGWGCCASRWLLSHADYCNLNPPKPIIRATWRI